jgi:hypothetical protein
MAQGNKPSCRCDNLDQIRPPETKIHLCQRKQLGLVHEKVQPSVNCLRVRTPQQPQQCVFVRPGQIPGWNRCGRGATVERPAQSACQGHQSTVCPHKVHAIPTLTKTTADAHYSTVYPTKNSRSVRVSRRYVALLTCRTQPICQRVLGAQVDIRQERNRIKTRFLRMPAVEEYPAACLSWRWERPRSTELLRQTASPRASCSCDVGWPCRGMHSVVSSVLCTLL